MVAKIDNKIYGCSNFDILLFNSDVSSYKNSVDKNVPKHAMNPNKLLFNPKNKIV